MYTIAMKKILKDQLKHVTIFAGIRDDALDKYFSSADVILKEAGDILIKEGAQSEEIYIVLKGHLFNKNISLSLLKLRQYNKKCKETSDNKQKSAQELIQTN